MRETPEEEPIDALDGRAWPSIRHRHFAQAMADHRALQLLRDLTDHDTAVAIIDEGGTLSSSEFSYDRGEHVASRRAIDDAIMASLGAAEATARD